MPGVPEARQHHLGGGLIATVHSLPEGDARHVRVTDHIYEDGKRHDLAALDHFHSIGVPSGLL